MNRLITIAVALFLVACTPSEEQLTAIKQQYGPELRALKVREMHFVKVGTARINVDGTNVCVTGPGELSMPLDQFVSESGCAVTDVYMAGCASPADIKPGSGVTSACLNPTNGTFWMAVSNIGTEHETWELAHRSGSDAAMLLDVQEAMSYARDATAYVATSRANGSVPTTIGALADLRIQRAKVIWEPENEPAKAETAEGAGTSSD